MKLGLKKMKVYAISASEEDNEVKVMAVGSVDVLFVRGGGGP